MRKAFKYRLYPSRVQTESIDQQLGQARRLYNAAIQERRDAYRSHGISLNYYDQANQLKDIRANGDLELANYSCCQDILRRADKAYKAFFRRVKSGEKPGYPRFQGRDRFDSFTFPAWGDGCHITADNRLKVQGIGIIKVKMHRPLEGKIKTLTLKREGAKWYAVFSCEVAIDPLPKRESAVGIDVGIEYFAVTSDGEFIENPRFLRNTERNIRIAQRRVSRRKKGGSNRRKAIKQLSRQHEKVRNQRMDFAHKISRRIVNEYGVIAVENLQVKNMIRNHHLAKSISDAAWGEFFRCTAYKAEWASRVFLKVNPNGTSQDCAFCGAHVPKSLSVRIHRCPECGVVVPRDFNSSVEILRRGLRLWELTRDNSPNVSQEAVCFS